MPTLVRWPGAIEPGSVTGQTGYFPDILPTMAELAGVSSPSNLDGISLVPTLLGNQNDQLQHDYLFWRLGQDKAVMKGNWKLVVERVDGGSPQTFLYDIENDPGETTDLSGQYPALVTELEQILQQEDGETVIADWEPQLKAPAVRPGCTDPAYAEYDSAANVDDGSACQTLHTGTEAGNSNKIHIDQLHCAVSISGPGTYRVIVQDVSGKSIYQAEITGPGKLRYSNHIRQSGIFVLKVISNGRIISRKVVLY